jgi:hypothetical protein
VRRIRDVRRVLLQTAMHLPILPPETDFADYVKQLPEDLLQPKFGYLEDGEKRWAFVLDEPAEKPASLYIDTNGDGDLTNDPEVKWEARTQAGTTMYSGEGQVDLGDGQIGTVRA